MAVAREPPIRSRRPIPEQRTRRSGSRSNRRGCRCWSGVYLACEASSTLLVRTKEYAAKPSAATASGARAFFVLTKLANHLGTAPSYDEGKSKNDYSEEVSPPVRPVPGRYEKPPRCNQIEDSLRLRKCQIASAVRGSPAPVGVCGGALCLGQKWPQPA